MENNKDLLWIKSKFGEEMMKLCRRNFARILEVEGVLPKLLQKYFMKHRSLVKDIIAQNKEDDFKAFIFSKIDIVGNKIEINSSLSAKELLEQAGYILYPECKTEADIQSFRHYYYRPYSTTPVYRGGRPETRAGEELCTFNGERLKLNRVWFAVKKNVDEIRREDFEHPLRQDAYGTSVLSIQFTKGKCQSLSIKNRYNHTVNNPDNTFNSNLDNIIDGLSDAFERDYGVRDRTNSGRSSFELENYVMANDGRFYPYNMEINNIYYCPNNVIIENFKPKQLPSHQILADYFVIDCKNNTIKTYDKNIQDSFIADLRNNQRIMTSKNGLIYVTKENGDEVIIKLNNRRQIVGFEDKNLGKCGYNYLRYNTALTELNLPNVEKCGYDFLYENQSLKKVNLTNLRECGESFLYKNNSMESIDLPNMIKCGDYFMADNINLKHISANNLLTVGSFFLSSNLAMDKVSFEKLHECGSHFLGDNLNTYYVHLPNMEECGNFFMTSNRSLRTLTMEKLRKCGASFLCENELLEEINLPYLEICKHTFLLNNKYLTSISFPSLRECGNSFIGFNEIINQANLPVLSECGNHFLSCNNSMTKLCLPMLKEAGDSFMRLNKSLIQIQVPSLEKCWDDFLFSNKILNDASFPRLSRCGDGFLYNNNSLRLLDLSQLSVCGRDFMALNKILTEINLNWLHCCGDNFLLSNNNLKYLIVPWLEKCGDNFMRYNTTLESLYAPGLENWGSCFLSQNQNVKSKGFRNLPDISRTM